MTEIIETVQIRQVVLPDDFTSLLHLWGSVGPSIGISRSDELSELVKKYQADPGLFLVAELNGQIIATVIGGFDGRRGLIYHLAVAQDHQKKGLGDHLLQQMENLLKERGCVKAYLMVKQGNPDLEQFYEDRNWHSMEHVKLFGKSFI